MEIEYKIYKLIDPRNNQIRYVGLTFDTLKQRLKSHRSEKSTSHKSNWIKLIQEEGFQPIIELIESNIDTYGIACEREIYWINKLKEEGHKLTNLASGGNKNKKMSDETKLKMSEYWKKWYKNNKRAISNETKKKISESTKIRMKDLNEIEKLKISNKRYEDSKTREQKIQDILVQKSRKSVVQYDMSMNYINDYLSINQAYKSTGIESSNITKCCKGKVSTAGGFIWRFENDTTPLIPRKKRKSICVIQYDMNKNYIKDFSSVEEASIETRAPKTGIYACCNGHFNHSGGYIWKYKIPI